MAVLPSCPELAVTRNRALSATRPSLLQVGGQTFEGRILLEEWGPLRPGDAVEVPIKFLSWELAEPHLPSERVFRPEREE